MNKNNIWTLFLVLSCLLVASLNCYFQPQQSHGLYAEMQTNKGKIVAFLEFEKVPMSVVNFVGLAEGTIKNAALPEGTPYYNGTVFHRVVPGHVIQAGAPAGVEQGSTGYTYPNEPHPELSHGKAGMLGIANRGPHTNGGQWYITLGDRSYLDGDYTVFGHVVEGMEVVNNIVQGDRVEKITIKRIGAKAMTFKADTQTFDDLVEARKSAVKDEEAVKQMMEKDAIAKHWPNAVETVSGVKYVINRNGLGPKPKEGKGILVKYTGEFLIKGVAFRSRHKTGLPDFGGEAEYFEIIIGKTKINPGFDEMVKDMRKGERRTVVLSSELAYGVRGFYGPSIPREKRFVISPNTALVYEIEIIDMTR